MLQTVAQQIALAFKGALLIVCSPSPSIDPGGRSNVKLIRYQWMLRGHLPRSSSCDEYLAIFQVWGTGNESREGRLK